MLTLQINGQPKDIDLAQPAKLSDLLEHLEIKLDRVAVEHNGNIAPRASWNALLLTSGDRLEIVHFVGGGAT